MSTGEPYDWAAPKPAPKPRPLARTIIVQPSRQLPHAPGISPCADDGFGNLVPLRFSGVLQNLDFHCSDTPSD